MIRWVRIYVDFSIIIIGILTILFGKFLLRNIKRIFFFDFAKKYCDVDTLLRDKEKEIDFTIDANFGTRRHNKLQLDFLKENCF